MIRKILTFFIICFIASSTWATENNSILKWQKWSPKVFEQARREGRLVLLDLTAEWCQFCRKMDETSYRDPQVINIIKHNYIPVRAAEETNSALAKRYDGRPTTVIFDGNGIEIIKRRGYLRPQWLLWLLEAVAQNPSHEAHK
jgi:thiol:disulfide interchange protein